MSKQSFFRSKYYTLIRRFFILFSVVVSIWVFKSGLYVAWNKHQSIVPNAIGLSWPVSVGLGLVFGFGLGTALAWEIALWCDRRKALGSDLDKHQD